MEGIDILFWVQIYLLVGLLSMGVFDLMHYLTKDALTEDEYVDNAFTNFERFYVIILWPFIWIGFVATLLTVKK